tara:strand:- start:429 stop:656 length:228 start_codon:yes stop_codon:yes gene_type:complete
MSKYDLVSIVRPTAEDSVVEELHKTITDLITTNGGNVSDQGVWQKRKLAYQILILSMKVFIQLLHLKVLEIFLES